VFFETELTKFHQTSSSLSTKSSLLILQKLPVIQTFFHVKKLFSSNIFLIEYLISKIFSNFSIIILFFSCLKNSIKFLAISGQISSNFSNSSKS